MSLHRNKRLQSLVALLVFMNQIMMTSPALVYAQSELQFEAERAASVASESYQEKAQTETTDALPLQMLAIFSNDQTLAEVKKQAPEAQDQAAVNRESFDYNQPLLDQAAEDGLPIAFIVDDLDAEKLKSLVSQTRSEVLILAFRSDDKVKYLLYTSGEEGDVRVNSRVGNLIESLQSEGSILVAHTHVDAAAQGPSTFDQNHAQQTEAVLTADGAYLYGPGMSTEKPLDLAALMNWFQQISSPLDEAAVNAAAHQLLAEVETLRDQLKTVPEFWFDTLKPFRQSGVTTDERLSQPTTFTSTTVVAADTAGKSDAAAEFVDKFSVSVLSTARLRVSYSDLDAENESAGVRIENADGALIDLSSLSQLVFKLLSSEETSDLKVEIIQSGTSTRDVFNIAGVGTAEKTYQLDLTQLSFEANTIESIQFVRDSAMSPGSRGYFEVVLPSQSGYGVNPSLADNTKEDGNITQLPLGATRGALADTAAGAQSVLSDESLAGGTINYSGLEVANAGAGLTWDYEAPGKNFSKRQHVVLALKGTAAGARFEIEDIAGRKASVDLSGISTDAFRYYTIDLNDPAIASQAVDLSAVKRVSVVTDQALAGNASGSLEVELVQMTADTPMTGTTTSVTQLETGKFEIKVYAIDPTRTDLHGKLLRHTLQQYRGDSNYEITTLEVLADGTDTGKWLSLHQQKKLAENKFEIKTYTITGDVPGAQSKGSRLAWFIQENQGGENALITEIYADKALNRITTQKPLSATALQILTYAADFNDTEIRLMEGSTTGSAVTNLDKLTATLAYEALDLSDAAVSAGATWVYPAATWPTGVDFSGMTLNFSLRGTAAKVTLVIEDVNGQTGQVTFEDIQSANDTSHSVSLDEPTLTSAIDITQVKQINFLVNGPDAGNAAGLLDIQLKELPVSNADGIKGALQSHVIQEDMGGGVFRLTTFNGPGTDEATAIIEQKELAENTMDIKSYQTSIVPEVVLDSQNFEGDFPPAGYTSSGDAAWIQDTAQFHDGIASAASGDIDDNGRSVLALTYEAPQDGELSFFWKVSSETNFDYFYFCVDQETCSQETSISSISGETDWAKYSAELSAGPHSLTWVYEKEGSISTGTDRGWLDEIKFGRSQKIRAVLESHVIQESLSETSTRMTTLNVEAGVSTDEVISIVEQTILSETLLEIKTYQVNPDGSQGALKSHVIQEDLGDGVVRITSFNVDSSDDVLSIIEQKQLGANILEVRTYQVNPDGSKGDLQEDVVQEDLGEGLFRLTSFKIQDGLSTDEVVSVVMQTQIAEETFEIQTYLNVVEPGISQDFEGAFPPENYTSSGDVSWHQDTTVFHDGAAAAASGDVDDDGRSVLQSTYTVAAEGTLSFFWKVSSETLYDYLYFCVDQENCNAETALSAINGITDWAQYSTQLSAGTHTLSWIYEKDHTLSEGSDMGWIDDVHFAETSTANLVLQSRVVQEGLAANDFRITTLKVVEGVATDEVVTTEDQTAPVAEALNAKAYEAAAAPAVIAETQSLAAMQPLTISSEAGSFDTESAGQRFDPDDGRLLSTENDPGPTLDDLFSNNDDFLGRDVSGNRGSGSSGSSGSSDGFGEEIGGSRSTSFLDSLISTSEWGSLSSAGSNERTSGLPWGRKNHSNDELVLFKGVAGYDDVSFDEATKSETESVGSPIADSLLYFLLTPFEKMQLEISNPRLFQSLQYLQYQSAKDFMEQQAPAVEEKREEAKKYSESASAKSLFERVFRKNTVAAKQRNLRWLKGRKVVNQSMDPRETLLYRG